MPKINESHNAVYIGIDPGKSGGIVAIDGNEVFAVPMPATEKDVWECISEIVSRTVYNGASNIHAVIEKVHALPNQGMPGMFKFGVGYGGLRMALIATSAPFEEVPPIVWMRALGIRPRGKSESKRDWKNRIRGKAQQLYPEVDVTLNTADALLIATYCKWKHEGTLSGFF